MNRLIIRFGIASFLLLCACISSDTAFAQGSTRIIHAQTKEIQSDPPFLGRDLWFCIPMNYDPNKNSDKYFQVYVTAYRNTTVHFQIGNGPIISKPVSANKVTIFKSPTSKNPAGDIALSTEIHTSGIVEPKGVHIWTDDANISVYFLSRVPFTTDGSFIIPTTGWGKEYVVGAYESIDDPSGGADWPSEFAIVSNQDGTIVTITPNCDLRIQGQPSNTEHKAGTPFTVNLQRGECVQYQAILPTSDVPDVTGTYIKSNNPVGVMAGSVCPYIPFPNGYCDYVMDMLQPIRTWSKNYLTSPFAGRKYGGDVYLVVGTHDAQQILRNGAQVALVNKYGYYFIYDDQAASPPSQWTSDAPFELIQFVPSAKFGAPAAGTTRNQGDPAEVVINAVDQFSKKIIFQTPTIDLASGQTNFTNYVNIIVPKADTPKTTYDGRNINSPLPNVKTVQKFPIGATGWMTYRIQYDPGKGEGTHIVSSDTGVGVYIYGYGTDDSYAWSGALGTKTPNDPDSIPPVAIAEGPCFCAHVRISDTGPGQSKLSSFAPDSSFNMVFFPDRDFVPGTAMDSSFYDMCIIDSSIEAYLSVAIYDNAGNITTVTSIYKPQLVGFKPSSLNFGSVTIPGSKFLYDTLYNSGTAPFHFKKANLVLSNGNLGLTVDSAADGDIPAGGFILIKIKGAPKVAPTVRDTLSINDECVKAQGELVLNGGQADFDIGPFAFDCTPLNANRKSKGFFITNPSGIDATIDKIWLDVDPNFIFDATDPANITPGMIIPKTNLLTGMHEIFVTFNPQTVGPHNTVIHVQSGSVIKTATITGIACMPDVVSTTGTGVTTCDDPVTMKVQIKNTGTFHDSVFSVKGKNSTTGFGPVVVYDSLDNIITLPIQLDPDQTIYASVQYTPAMGTSGCFVDSIIVTRRNGDRVIEDPTQTPFVTVCVKFFEGTLQVPQADFGTLPAGSAVKRDFVEFCNTGKDPLTVTSIDSLPPYHSSSFKLANVFKIGGVSQNSFPITLAVGECLDIFVDFDPSNSNITLQTDSFAVNSNDCVKPLQIPTTTASLTIGGPKIQGFNDPALFSCDVHTNNVTYTNPNQIAGTITAVTVTGDPNFTYSGAQNIPIASGATVNLPILFTPSPINQTKIYTGMVHVDFDNGAGGVNHDSASVSAIGQGMDLSVTSQFATPAQVAGKLIDLPVQLAIDKHGLVTPLAFLNINRIELTYTYDQNILDIVKNDVKAAVTLPPGSTWSVDPATSKVDPVAGTLQVNLVNTTGVLSDAELAKQIATISFKPSIPKTGNTTQVQLTSSKFINTLNQPIASCVAVAKKDSNFSLIYECGDTTLQRFLNGKYPMRAFPVNPNPAGAAQGDVLSFKYSAAVAGTISLSIYDELGKEVTRIINNQSMPAGTYELKYSVKGLSEGSYIFRYTLNHRNVTSGRFIIQR
jgi:hypothetical protein